MFIVIFACGCSYCHCRHFGTVFVASIIVVDCFGLYFHSFLQPCQFCGPWRQSLVDNVCDMFPLRGSFTTVGHFPFVLSLYGVDP